MKIINVIITPMPGVIATFEHGTSKTLISFYPNEVSFQATEFTGLTEEEAHSLFQHKNAAYLLSRSPITRESQKLFTLRSKTKTKTIPLEPGLSLLH